MARPSSGFRESEKSGDSRRRRALSRRRPTFSDMTAPDTAAADTSAAEMRERLTAYIDRLTDAEVLALGKDLLPTPEPAPPTHEDDPRNPLILTEEESRVRLMKGLAQADAGEGMSLGEFKRRNAERRARRVRG